MIAVLTSLLLLSAPSADDAQSAADSLRQHAVELTQRADSLKAEWDVQWKRSDSLRIESMLVRMQSNRLLREAWATKKEAERIEAEEAQRQELARLEALALEAQQPVSVYIGPPEPSTRQAASAPQASSKAPASVRPRARENHEEDGDVQEELTSNTPDVVSAEDDEILAALSERSSLSANAERVRSGRVRSGQTLSDSITADVMSIEPETGIASYYGDKFHGKKTSSGETYNMWAMTCAHRWLPFGTYVRVTNLRNGRSVVVKVTDRGPFHHGRLIDVSKGAAKELDMIRSGTTDVSVQVVEPEGG